MKRQAEFLSKGFLLLMVLIAIILFIVSSEEKKKGKHWVVVGFNTQSFKNGHEVAGQGSGVTYHSNQVEYNPEFDADSITVHYFQPVNKVFTFVKQKDSTWLLLK